MDEEVLDLVDKNDKVIGTIQRKDYDTILKSDLGYIRSADLFIVNSEGNVYVPTRTADKTIAPNGFDYSVGGHVESGEDYLATIVREAHEEVDMIINPDDVLLLDKSVFETIKYIRRLYLYISDDTPIFNPDDFVKADWMTPDELLSRIDEGHPAKETLYSSVVLLKEYLSLV